MSLKLLSNIMSDFWIVERNEVLTRDLFFGLGCSWRLIVLVNVVVLLISLDFGNGNERASF